VTCDPRADRPSRVPVRADEMATAGVSPRARLTANDHGIAVVLALLLAVLLGAIAAALLALTTTETSISLSFRHGQEAAYGAEAALERALHDLAAMADWSTALSAPPGNATSTFDDGETVPRTPAGRSLDLARLTSDRQAESDAHAGPDVFGADSPEWRLFAHAPLTALLRGPGLDLPLYLVVWVADDEWDGDGDPTVDRNGRILVRAQAFGAGGTRRSVEARVGRTGGGDLQLVAWREPR
jgi:hypothetical protein